MSRASDFVIRDGALTRYTGIDRAVVIPDGVSGIGKDAFSGCIILTSIVIPKGVTRIEDGAFSGCSSLTSISIPDSVTNIGSSAFWGCSSLTSISIPDSVTNIGSSAFWGCGSLTSISIPDGVTNIGSNTFSGCSSLTSITVPDRVTSIGSYAFNACSSLTSITVPDSVTNIGSYAFNACRSLTNIIIPDNVTSIDSYAFNACSSLTSIVIPDSVTDIGSYAFDACNSLTNIAIPDSVTSIGNGAFRNCGSLTSIVIPEGVTSIGGWVFSGCGNLTNIVIPESVTSIGDRVFAGCQCLHTLTVVNPQLRFGEAMFGDMLPIGLEDKGSALWPHLTDGEIKRYYLNKSSWGKLDADARARLFLARQGKTLLPLYVGCVSDFESFGNAVLTRLPEKPLAKECEAVANFVILFADKAPKKLLEQMFGTIAPLKAASKALKRIADELEKTDIQLLADLLKASQKVEANTQNALQEVLCKAEARAVRPIEKYVAEFTKDYAIRAEVQSAAKNGIPYAGETENCSENALAVLLEEYAREYKAHAKNIPGGLGVVELLEDGSGLRPSKVADEIAEALDRKRLTAFLRGLAYGAKYRLFILAYVRYADEAEIQTFTEEITEKLKGHAKERYWAQNGLQTLYLSETKAAIKLLDKKGLLEKYAEAHGTTVMELRHMTMPNIGLSARGTKAYFVGGARYEARLMPDLTVALFDPVKNTAVRAFPQKGVDPKQVKTAKEDLAALKKSVKQFVKEQSEILCRMHVTGEPMNQPVWKKVYFENPVLCVLAENILWADAQNRPFALVEGKPVTADGKPFEPVGQIHVAHALEMSEEVLRQWRQFLLQMKRSELFEQVWEPVLSGQIGEVNDRYSGVFLTTSERNLLKKKLKQRGIPTRTDEIAKEYDPYTEQYLFANSNQMHLGDSLSVRYSIQANGITIEDMQVQNPNKKELNAIFFELDKISVLHHIKADRGQVLTKEMLDRFSAAQICEFIDCAIESKAVNCTAILLNYKNENCKQFEGMDSFVLTW